MSKVPTDRLLLKLDVRTPVVGNKFVIFDKAAQVYKVARFAKTGDGRSFVRQGKTHFPTLEAAQAAIGVGPNVLETIRRGLAKIGGQAKVASHLHGDAFVITKPSPGGWRFYKAKLTSHGVTIAPEEYTDRGAASVQVQRDGGPTPTVDLSSLPARPLGLYA